MNETLSTPFTNFAVQRCIRIFTKNIEQYEPSQAPHSERYLPIDTRQDDAILRQLLNPEHEHAANQKLELALVLIQDGAFEYAAVDAKGGLLFELASRSAPSYHRYSFADHCAYGGVFWRVVGNTRAANEAPVQLQVFREEGAARGLCATFQAMLDAYLEVDRRVA